MCYVKVLIFISVFAVSQSQFPLETSSQKPWTGPIANHEIGIHPGDTPEVAAAKAQHLNAYRDVLSVLPELPLEERYIMHGLPLPAVRTLQQQTLEQRHAQHNKQPVIQHHTPHIPIEMPAIPHIQTHVVAVPTTPVVPTLLAEEIPRSPIGEVPEVHSARVAHLKAVEEVRAALPPLTV